MTATTTETASRPFVISRLLDAPRELVFKTWTEAEHMSWWGPKGITIAQQIVDLRPGGRNHYCMQSPDSSKKWGLWRILEVIPSEKLVFLVSFSDEAGGLTRHPLSADWPLEMHSTVTFVDREGKTLLTVEWTPHNATDVECRTFEAGFDSMRQGWGGSFDKLESYLATL